MKGQSNFKSLFSYAFRAGMSPRLYAFAVILVMNLAFIIPGLFGVLPGPALITGVSLSGTAIAVMAVFNIIGDISISSSLFSASNAPFYALTPAPRKNTLLACVLAMLITDFVTMAISIAGVITLSINLGGFYSGDNIWALVYRNAASYATNALLPVALLIAAYLFIMMLIIFCRAFRNSHLYNKRAGGFLAFLLAVGIYYLSTVSVLLLAPFGTVTRVLGWFQVTVGHLGTGMYALLLLIFAAVMFILTSSIMERKMNI